LRTRTLRELTANVSHLDCATGSPDHLPHLVAPRSRRRCDQDAPTRAEIAATEEREERELSEDWDRYCALTFAEKIRQEGVMSWLLHTNTGVTVMVVFGLALGLAVVSVLVPLGLSR
jgi:hypothetical protein